MRQKLLKDPICRMLHAAAGCRITDAAHVETVWLNIIGLILPYAGHCGNIALEK